MRSHRLLLITLVASFAWLGSANAQGKHERGEYERLTAEAVREYNAGDFAEARALFERANALQPNARTLRGLGACSFELRHYAQAIEELQAALRDTRNTLNATQRAEAEDIVTRAQRFVAHVQIEVVPEEAKLLLDGVPLQDRELVLDLGDYVLTARAPGYREEVVKLHLEGGQTRDVRIELVAIDLSVSAAPLETGSPAHGPSAIAQTAQTQSDSVFKRWWFWTAAGVVIAAGVTSALVLTHDPGHKPPERGDVGGTIETLRSAP